MINTIVVVVNKGGVVEDVLVSNDLADDVNVHVVDFCTDDDNEYEEAIQDYDAIIKSGQYHSVY